jgi:membrane protein
VIRIKALVSSVLAWLKALLRGVRRRRPMFDHLCQAGSRYSKENGSRLVSVITLPGFLSFFPILGLALSVAGFIAHYDHSAQAQITKAVGGYFPGLDVGTLVTSITEHRTSTGVISLVGLLVSGLGLITTLRGAVRSLWRLPQSAGNFFLAKGRDLATMLALGLAVIISFVLTAGATSATHVLVTHTPLPNGGASTVLLRIAAIAVAVAGDVVLFGTAFTLLPQVEVRMRETLDGALFAAIGFEILKSVGAIYLQRTTSNPLYGTFALAIGLLAWTNLVARLFVFAAAWVVTAPYTPDAPPSATALGPAGVPAVPPAAAVVAPTRRQETAARGAATAVLGALGGVAVVVGVRAVRAVVPRR